MKIGNVVLDVPAVLAPMAGITDQPFRILARRMGCGLTVSEMVSSKGLIYGNEKTKAMLRIAPEERPTAIQLFGSVPEELARAAKLVEQWGADIVDFNMGCPVQKIVANGEGSALMRKPELAYEILAAMVEAVKIPVTVKMRLGWNGETVNVVECALAAERAGVAAVAVHGRTRIQFYEGKADWGPIGAVKRALRIPVIGNGDVASTADAARMLAETGVDGVMVGRGCDGNPWLFRELKAWFQHREPPAPPSFDERLDLALEHLRMLCEFKGEQAAVREFRRHMGCYIKGMPNAATERARFYTITTLGGFERQIEAYRDVVAGQAGD